MPRNLKLEIVLNIYFWLVTSVTVLGALLWLCQPAEHSRKQLPFTDGELGRRNLLLEKLYELKSDLSHV